MRRAALTWRRVVAARVESDSARVFIFRRATRGDSYLTYAYYHHARASIDRSRVNSTARVAARVVAVPFSYTQRRYIAVECVINIYYVYNWTAYPIVRE